MRGWYKVVLSDSDISAGRHKALQNQFEILFRLSRSPRDAALLGGKEIAEHSYYFSPGAARIASQLIGRYSGLECSPPARSEVDILIADATLGSISFGPAVPKAE